MKSSNGREDCIAHDGARHAKVRFKAQGLRKTLNSIRGDELELVLFSKELFKTFSNTLYTGADITASFYTAAQ